MDALTPLAMPATAAAPAEQSVLVILSLAALAWALSRRPWQLLRRDDLQNGWLGALVLLALLWTLRATLRGGLAIQLFGATLAVTLFGLPLALLSLFVVDLVSFLGLDAPRMIGSGSNPTSGCALRWTSCSASSPNGRVRQSYFMLQ